MVGSCRLTDAQESLESSLMEKENTLAKTREKLELVSSLQEALSLKELHIREASDKLLQSEHCVRLLLCCFWPRSRGLLRSCFTAFSLQLENISQKCSSSEKQCSELKAEVGDLTQKLILLKEKVRSPHRRFQQMESRSAVSSLASSWLSSIFFSRHKSRKPP